MRILRNLIAAAVSAAAMTSCSGDRPARGDSVASNGPSWRAAASMTYARAAHAVVGDDTSIYAIAGTGALGRPVLPIERFDGNAWRIEGTLPGDGLNAPAAVALDGRIYVIGGFNTVTNVPTDEVLVYDIARRTRTREAPLPSARGGHAAVVRDGKIHVLGGGNSQTTLADHDVFDPTIKRWSRLAPLPRAEGSPAAVKFGGKLYAIGGRSGPNDFGSVDIYDAVSDSWSAGPSIELRGSAGAVVYCEAIWLFGGESQARQASLGEVLRLPRNGTWALMSTMPTARNFARAVVLGDAVYVVGGSPTPEPSHASEGSPIVERYHVDCR